MADLFTLSATDLAALLCSRVCHDIISPVGAINNGLELLDEGGADEDAMRLIRQSARNASARLQFARIAFGAAGSAGMLIDTGDAEAVAIAFLKNEKPELTWNGARALLPKNKVKLLLNLILVANAAIRAAAGWSSRWRTWTPSRASRSPPAVRCCACRQSSWNSIRATNPRSRSTRIQCSPITRCSSRARLT